MLADVLVSADGGTRVAVKQMELIAYEAHMFWATKDEFYTYIVAEVNGKYFHIANAFNYEVENATFMSKYSSAEVVKQTYDLIQRGFYFSPLMLQFCKELGKYDEAIDSIRRYEERIAKAKAEREEKDEIEKKKKAEERQKEVVRQQKMIDTLRQMGLLNKKLTKIQQAQLIANLDDGKKIFQRVINFDDDSKSKAGNVFVSFYSLIVNYRYQHVKKYVYEYGKRGHKLATPHNEYAIFNDKGSSYPIPGNLGKFLVPEKVIKY